MSHSQNAHQIDVDLLEETGTRFVIESLLGEGTYGEVHRARDTAVSFSWDSEPNSDTFLTEESF